MIFVYTYLVLIQQTTLMFTSNLQSPLIPFSLSIVIHLGCTHQQLIEKQQQKKSKDIPTTHKTKHFLLNRMHELVDYHQNMRCYHHAMNNYMNHVCERTPPLSLVNIINVLFHTFNISSVCIESNNESIKYSNPNIASHTGSIMRPYSFQNQYRPSLRYKKQSLRDWMKMSHQLL